MFITDLLLDTKRDPHEAIYYYGGFTGTELHAVRSGRWKLHVTHPYVDVVPGSGGAGVIRCWTICDSPMTIGRT